MNLSFLRPRFIMKIKITYVRYILNIFNAVMISNNNLVRYINRKIRVEIRKTIIF